MDLLGKEGVTQLATFVKSPQNAYQIIPLSKMPQFGSVGTMLGTSSSYIAGGMCVTLNLVIGMSTDKLNWFCDAFDNDQVMQYLQNSSDWEGLREEIRVTIQRCGSTQTDCLTLVKILESSGIEATIRQRFLEQQRDPIRKRRLRSGGFRDNDEMAKRQPVQEDVAGAENRFFRHVQRVVGIDEVKPSDGGKENMDTSSP